MLSKSALYPHERLSKGCANRKPRTNGVLRILRDFPGASATLLPIQQADENGRGFSADLIALYSFDLQKRTHLKIADKNSLRFPAPYVEGWITGLVDVSADASQLCLSVGMMSPAMSAGVRMVNHPIGANGLAERRYSPRFSSKGNVLLGARLALDAICSAKPR
jgi:hypothetical protein